MTFLHVLIAATAARLLFQVSVRPDPSSLDELDAYVKNSGAVFVRSTSVCCYTIIFPSSRKVVA